MTGKLPVGVHHSKGNRFRAVIRVSRKQYHLGTYGDVQTAEKTYIQAKKMTDDLLERIGKVEIKTVKEYVEVPRPSIWSKALKLIKRGE